LLVLLRQSLSPSSPPLERPNVFVSAVFTSYAFFLQCSLGLEKLLQEEVEELGLSCKLAEGGVEVRGELEELFRVCFRSHLTENVRIRLGAFQARDFDELKAQLAKLPLRAYLAAGQPVRVKVVSHKSRLWHSGAVKQRVCQVLSERAGFVVRDDDTAHVFHVRVSEDRVQLSLEAAGRLYRRGYRAMVEKASLRETLAAALLRATFSLDLEATLASRFLWDPFCGAGTIALEALHQSRRGFIERLEPLAFTQFRVFDPDLYRAVLEEERSRANSSIIPSDLTVLGSDASERALAAARGNYEAGNFDGGEFLLGDIERVVENVPEGALVVTNPPYGKRLEKAEGVQKLMRVLKARPDLKPAVALLGGAARSAVPKSARALFRTKNGRIPVSARLLAG
jgi:putative N6-adenine-specific DNA methylase